MSGINIPPSIFAASGPPYNTAAQPASTSEEGWKESKLKGLQSWQDKLPPALSWQPEGSLPTLPNSSTPMSDLSSFGLNSIASKGSLGERVSLASKQMALSVLDILATKPPGPVDSRADRAGPLGADATPAASDAKADMHTELSVRSGTALASPHATSRLCHTLLCCKRQEDSSMLDCASVLATVAASGAANSGACLTQCS